MKKFILPVIAIAAAAIVAVIIAVTAGNKEDVYRLIKVNSYEGSVYIHREETMNAFEGLQLISEDSVEVGEASLLELIADSDKHIVAEENTNFVIHSVGNEKSGNITIDLLCGKSLFTIENKLPDGSEFMVNTPNASLSVRGTIFSVEYYPEEMKTVIEVMEGKVLVTYKGGEKLLEKGDIIIIKEVDGEIQVETFAGEADVEAISTVTTEITTTTPTETTAVSETTTVSETTAEETTTAETTVSEEITTTVTTTAESTEAVTTTTTPVTTTTTASTTTAATTTKAKTTKVTTTKEETTTTSKEDIVDENQNIGYLSISRYFQLTGDNNYQTLEADYYTIATSTNEEGGAHTNHLLGMTANVELYNDSYNVYIESPYLSDVLNELKPYIESHIDEINEFFEENKNDAMKQCKEEKERSVFNYTYASMDIDWLPDTITIKNETGSYLMNITRQSINLVPTYCSVEDAPSTSSLISDYFIIASPSPYIEGDVMYYIDNVNIGFGGTIEKIS